MAAPYKENKMASKKWPLKKRMTSLLLFLEMFLHFQEIVKRKNVKTLPHRSDIPVDDELVNKNV